MKTLCVCIIVYNEEDLIQYTFPQVYDLADQIVIIDGSPFGPSTDATYQVLRPYLKSPKTYYESGTYGKVFEYTNSFNTVMRNEYLKHVSCDFILQCALPESLIISENIKKIIDVNENDLVISALGNVQKVRRKISSNYNGNLVGIKPLGGDTIWTTENHPYLAVKTDECSVNRGKYNKRKFCSPLCIYADKPCYRFKKTNDEKICERKFKSYIASYYRADQLEVNDIVLIPRIKKEVDIKFDIERVGGKDIGLPKEIVFDSYLAELLGYYIAEGSTANANQCYCVKFNLHFDEDKLANRISYLLRKIFNNINVRIYKYEKDNSSRIIVQNKDVWNFFIQFGKGKDKCIPSKILYAKNKYLISFFIAWVKGDGWKKSKNTFTISSISKNIIYTMRMIAAKIGIYLKIHYSSRIDSRTGTLNETYLAQFNWKKLCKTKDKSRWWKDDLYFYIPIKDIFHKEYSGKVYNLSVSCDSSFLINGFATHNCDADEFWTWDDLEKIKDAIQIDGVTGINTGNLHFYIDVFHYLPGLGINQHHRIVKNEPNAFYSALRPNSVLYKGKHIAIATSGTFLERKDITCFHVGHALPWEDYKRKQSKFYYKNLKRNCWNVNSIAELNALTEQRDFNHPKLTEYNGPYPEYMAQAIRDEHPFFIRRIPCRKQ